MFVQAYSRVPSPIPISTSPTRFHGDDFFLFNVSISLSWLAMTASFAAITSFLAARADRRASDSAFLVSLSSLNSSLACFAVSRRDLSAAFSLSKAPINVRDAPNSSAAALQASTSFVLADCLLLIANCLSAPVAEVGEFGAEIGEGCGC
jgi:hypothetical protein